ncbi:putative wall-associated receptor kinase-like 16 [Papaver somniferum]|uniref:putative wall-associated receptor kinase-like 16 n=1 Tax=Papaver somniferum TaxID=3469 RepID=UPI000E6FB848|nr:putative wall-associated receptor kinase-like 16 [Papaver somniferum]
MALHVFLKFHCFLLLLWLPLSSTTETPNVASGVIKPGCQDKCGNVSIPYPFGIGDGCFLDKWFEITCNETLFNTPKPMYDNITVSNLSIPDGQMTAEVSIARRFSDKKIPGKLSNTSSASLGKFTFSSTKNKFIAIGCDIMGLLGLNEVDDHTATGCLSTCSSTTNGITNGSCTGTGCCVASIPPGLRAYLASVSYLDKNRTDDLSFNPISYAFLAEESSFNFSTAYLKNFKNKGTETVPVVIDWTIGNKSCDDAKRNLASYACGPNTDCISGSNSVPGYRCTCKEGYEGNPFLDITTGGCQDIDECSKDINPCKGSASLCRNTVGNYTCDCPPKHRSRYNNDIQHCFEQSNEAKFYKIIISACLSFTLLLVTSFWLYWGYRKRKHMKLKEELYKRNGGLFLNRLLKEREEDIANSIDGSSRERKGRSIVTIYSEEELRKATDNYHESQILGRGGFGTVYKGTLLNGEVVAIKKTKVVDRKQNEQFINEIVVLSQINHKNVVQLLGCCLESEVPLLVYEFVTNGTLHQHLHESRESQAGSDILSWENRLRIAAEVSGSLAYLHAEASIPIIHRDVKSSNVLLDKYYRAKVSDFGASRLIPTDQDQLSTVVQGTFGYLDPEYMQTEQLTEKSDVYSFGVLLAELLTGEAVICFKRPVEDKNLSSYFLSSIRKGRLFAIIDSSLVRNESELISSSVHGHQQIQQMGELAQKCLRVQGEKRPTMKEVAMVLHGLMGLSSDKPDVLDDEDIGDDDSKIRLHLLESTELLSYTDSMSTMGDTSKGILPLETEGR